MFEFKQPTLIGELLKRKLREGIPPMSHKFEPKVRPLEMGKRQPSMLPKMPKI